MKIYEQFYSSSIIKDINFVRSNIYHEVGLVFNLFLPLGIQPFMSPLKIFITEFVRITTQTTPILVRRCQVIIQSRWAF